MNKITTLAEYKIHKNKLNRESYAKKALWKNACNANGELINKPRVKKEKSNIDTKLKTIKKKKQMKVLLIIHLFHFNIYFVNICYLLNAVLNSD